MTGLATSAVEAMTEFVNLPSSELGISVPELPGLSRVNGPNCRGGSGGFKYSCPVGSCRSYPSPDAGGLRSAGVMSRGGPTREGGFGGDGGLDPVGGRPEGDCDARPGLGGLPVRR